MGKAAGWAACALAAPGHSSLSETRRPICLVSPVSGQLMLANHMQHGSHMSQKVKGKTCRRVRLGVPRAIPVICNDKDNALAIISHGLGLATNFRLHFSRSLLHLFTGTILGHINRVRRASCLLPLLLSYCGSAILEGGDGKTLASHLIAYYLCAFIIAHCCRCKGQRKSSLKASTRRIQSNR